MNHVEDHLDDGEEDEGDEPPPQDQEDLVVYDVQTEDAEGADALLASPAPVSIV